MPFLTRLRRPGARNVGVAALTVALAVFLAACGKDYPDSIFHQRTDVNRDVDYLFKILIWAGTAVFIFVEGLLVWTLIKFRKRPGQPAPEHVHGNTTLEIAWTVIPLIILVIIGIPTVRTIWKTESQARGDALQVEVIGHQWWWEFRYPQYGITTANELYLPVGRTANFKLNSADVIHSFWVPALSGKRDVVTNHTNYIWWTPDSAGTNAWNGACVEYCGTSHANMRFKTFTVSPEDFESWAKHQQQVAVGSQPVTPPPVPGPTNAVDSARGKSKVTAMPQVATAATPVADVAQAGFVSYPKEKIPAYAIPQTPYPDGMKFDDALLAKGDAANGAKLITGQGTCLACHAIKGNPMMLGNIGPNLTHIATRTTIAAGLYPNDPQHLARWIKNAREMKPGVTMPTLGLNEFDPVTKATMKQGLSDQQVADIVAYLQTLK
jgi:cytochrome c oxidase subunit 2